MKTVKRVPPIRLANRAAPMPTRAQQEAMWKSLRIREALAAAGHAHLASVFSVDRKSVEIIDLHGGPQIGVMMWGGEPWPSRENPAPRYQHTLVATAPLGKLDAELPAWEAAYKALIV